MSGLEAGLCIDQGCCAAVLHTALASGLQPHLLDRIGSGRITADDMSEQDTGEIAELLMELISRALDEPGISWRVGVRRPQDGNLAAPRPGSIASLLKSKQSVKPAVSAWAATLLWQMFVLFLVCQAA